MSNTQTENQYAFEEIPDNCKGHTAPNCPFIDPKVAKLTPRDPENKDGNVYMKAMVFVNERFFSFRYCVASNGHIGCDNCIFLFYYEEKFNDFEKKSVKSMKDDERIAAIAYCRASTSRGAKMYGSTLFRNLIQPSGDANVSLFVPLTEPRQIGYLIYLARLIVESENIAPLIVTQKSARTLKDAKQNPALLGNKKKSSEPKPTPATKSSQKKSKEPTPVPEIELPQKKIDTTTAYQLLDKTLGDKEVSSVSKKLDTAILFTPYEGLTNLQLEELATPSGHQAPETTTTTTRYYDEKEVDDYVRSRSPDSTDADEVAQAIDEFGSEKQKESKSKKLRKVNESEKNESLDDLLNFLYTEEENVKNKQAATPKVVEEPAPKANEEPAPKVVEEPAPKANEEPAPKVVEEPAPKANEEPAPKANEEPAPKVTEEPAPKANEEPAPTSPQKADAMETDKKEPEVSEDDKETKAPKEKTPKKKADKKKVRTTEKKEKPVTKKRTTKDVEEENGDSNGSDPKDSKKLKIDTKYVKVSEENKIEGKRQSRKPQKYGYN